MFLAIVEAGVETNVFGSGAQNGGSFGKISLSQGISCKCTLESIFARIRKCNEKEIGLYRIYFCVAYVK